MFGLADCNNFFVSCERSLRPDLNGKAVVVLSNNDGCAIARSNEAKKLGVKMGQPAFELRDMILRGDLIAFSGNHILYRDISIRIHDIFRRFAPEVLDYSVDEAFFNMNGVPECELEKIGYAVYEACMAEESIPVTIGFAPSKTLAKVATEIGKKSSRRVVVLPDKDGEINEMLRKIPIQDVWGIGRRLAKRLYMKGVYTAYDLAAKDCIWIRGEMGVVGERLWNELHGKSCIELEHLERKRQDSVSESRTFPIDIDDFDFLRSRLAIYCGHVSKRLRAMNGVCGSMTIWLCTNRFHLERGYSAPKATAEFNPPVCDAALIASTATALLEQIFVPGTLYKRAGVVLSDILPDNTLAPSLFEDVEEQRLAQLRSRKLMQAIDSVNKGCSNHRLKLASELTKGHIGHNDGYSSSFGPAKKI